MAKDWKDMTPDEYMSWVRRQTPKGMDTADRMWFLRDRKVDMHQKLEEIMNGNKVKELRSMDIQEKITLVNQWFEHFCQEHGFNVMRVEDSPSESTINLTIGKSSFPNVSYQAKIQRSFLQHTSPRELHRSWLPDKGRELMDGWTTALRQVRQSH